MDINAIDRILTLPEAALATPAKHPAQNRGEDDEVVSHLDRQAGQIVIQVVNDETKAAQSQPLPKDVIQLGEVVNPAEGRAIR